MKNMITNFKLNNYTCDKFYLSFIGYDIEAEKFGYYTVELFLKENNVSLPLYNIINSNRTINDIFDSTGTFIGTTSGTETVEEKTIDMSVYDMLSFYSGKTDLEYGNVVFDVLSDNPTINVGGREIFICSADGRMKIGAKKFSNLIYFNLFK